MTHTHKGTCQLCGRTQAVNNKTGKIAKHGYTVDYGFFSGTCGGSGHLPLQKDREELDLEVTAWEKMANKDLSLTEADIKSVPVRVRHNGINKTFMMEESAYILAHQNQRHARSFEQAVQLQLANIHSSAKHLLTHAADMKALADKVHGTELFEVTVSTEVKHTRDFVGRREANDFANELKEKGVKAKTRRLSMYSHTVRVYWTEAA